MSKNKKIVLEIKPRYKIGQEIFIPEKEHITQTKISGYEVQVIEQEKKPLGVISNYRIEQAVFIRRAEEVQLVDLVKESDFYLDKERATSVSKFMPVIANNETWRLAIGDRKVKEEDSPYHIDNSGLPSCCANISEARDILSFCRISGGLIIHERNILYNLLDSHGLKYDSEDPLAKILRQLKI